MNTKKLINTLKSAKYACLECGGSPLNGNHSDWNDLKCSICKRKKQVLPAKDFNYFRDEIKELTKKLKEEEKELKLKKKRNNRPLSRLWKDASTALQDYYRAQGLYCCNCGKPQQVMHHWAHFGSNTALRFTHSNLVPLCNGCHFTWHNQAPLEMKLKIEGYMKSKHGENWEQELIEIKKHYLVRTQAETRALLYCMIHEYKLNSL